MRHRSITLFLIATLLLCGCSRDNDSTKPVVKPLMEAVYASGFVVAKDQYEVFAQSEGYVNEKLVNDGDQVKKGDPLYIIASEQQTARAKLARESYDLAFKNFQDNSPVLRELRAALETASTKKKFDSTNFVRYQNLLSKNATSQSEFDRMKLTFENSTNDYLLQRSRYEKTKNQLHLELQNAKSQLAIAADESGRYVVRSEMDGLVFMTNKGKGELIRRNEVIAVLGRKEAFVLELDIDELDVQRVKVGQPVLVKIDAYPKTIFKAKVTKVYPWVDRRQQSLKADAILEQDLPGLFSGLALEANIIIREKQDALVIPKSKLLKGDSVVIKTDDGEKTVKVTTGIETLDEIEIIEGVDSSNFIVSNN